MNDRLPVSTGARDLPTLPPVAPALPPEPGLPLRSLFGRLRRHRLLVAGSIAASLGVVAAYTAWTAPTYETSLLLRIERRPTGMPEMLALFSGGSSVATEIEVLQSRSIAAEVIRAHALRLDVTAPRKRSRDALFSAIAIGDSATAGTYRIDAADPAGWLTLTRIDSGVVVARARPSAPLAAPGLSLRLADGAEAQLPIEFAIVPMAEAERAFAARLDVSRPNREADVIQVSYRGGDPALIQRVLNSVAGSFVARRQSTQKAEARSTVGFLHEQLDTLRHQLAVAEDSMKAFREDRQVVNLAAQSSSQIARLATLQADRNLLEAERRALSTLVDQVERAAAAAAPDAPSPYRRLLAFPTLLRNPAASELLRALAAVEDERTALLARRTMQDPDVMRLTGRIEELDEQLRALTSTYLSSLVDQIAAHDDDLRQYDAELAQIPAKEIAAARMERGVTVLQDLYQQLQTRLKEAEIVQAVDDPSVQIVDAAAVPTAPVHPKPLYNGLAGLVIGTILGLGGAAARELADRRIHSQEDARRASGLAVLGLVPRIRGAAGRERAIDRRGRRHARRLGGRTTTPQAGRGQEAASPAVLRPDTVTAREPATVADAYWRLQTNIEFAQAPRSGRTLLLTSALPDEGKTTSALNLAATLAKRGDRVLLIDADLRRGRIAAAVGVHPEPGVSDVLASGLPLAACTRRVALGGMADVWLDVLPMGTPAADPGALLQGGRLAALLHEAVRAYAVVVIDSPPLVLADALMLSRHVDGVAVVCRAHATEAEPLRIAVQQLATVSAPVLGVILNDVDLTRSHADSAYAYYRGAASYADVPS